MAETKGKVGDPGNLNGVAANRAMGRPFQKGQSGNPGGRSKLDKKIRDQYGDDLDNIMRVQVQIAQGKIPEGTSIEEVTAADSQRSAAWVYDRAYGKVKDQVEVSGGVSEEQAALLEALRLTPHERRKQLEAQDTTQEAPIE